MQNIGVEEGGFVMVQSCPPLLRGKFARFQPESSSFDAALKASGMRPFLESTLRHFSVLSKGQRIELNHGGATYGLRVLHTEPASTISILGGVDLEVEFTPALDTVHGNTASTWTDRTKDKASPSLIDTSSSTSGEHKDNKESQNSGITRTHLTTIRGDEDEDELLRKVMAMSLAEAGIPDDEPSTSVSRTAPATTAATEKLLPPNSLMFQDGKKFDTGLSAFALNYRYMKHLLILMILLSL
jgi:hypothetical protein